MQINGRIAKIVVVEDEGIIGLQIERALIDAGYEVPAVATSAEEALLIIEASSPDLVLMDIHIAGEVDGVEAAQKIRDRFNLPVIFVTAHADMGTLERARHAEPFGYIVKPISTLSLTSSIEMALHKHQIELRLAQHRAWLTTILQSIPDAVIVCGLNAKVEFLNDAAERLTGRKEADAVGAEVASFLQLHNGTNGDLTLQLLHRAVLGCDLIALPRETFLCLQPKTRVPVEGQLAISYSDHQPVGAIFTLRDTTVREQEDLQFRQEQKMLAVGQLASDISEDFCGLLGVVGDAAERAKKSVDELPAAQRIDFLEHMSSIQQASAMGISISRQLRDLGNDFLLQPVRTSLNGVIASTAPILRRMCGSSLQFELDLSPVSTSVLCHPHHLEQVLLNMFRNARERIAGSGRIRIATTVVSGNREHVRLIFQIERSGSAVWEPLGFPFEMDSPDIGLSVANAIVTAAEGVLRFIKTSDNSGELEVVLPRQKAAFESGASFVARRGTILLVSTDLRSTSAMENQLEAHGYVVIRSRSAQESVLVAQLCDSKIDVVIADADIVTARQRKRLQRIFTDRNALTKFICLTFEVVKQDRTWQPVLKPYKACDVTAVITALLVDVEAVEVAHC